MKVHRITGRHLFLEDTGAALWIETKSDQQISVVSQRIVQGAKDLGFALKPKIFPYKDETVFAIDFPCDLLYTACELLEWAIDADAEFSRVQAEFAREENISWRELKAWALEKRCPYFDDEDGVTLGLGAYSQTWALDSLPMSETLSLNDFRSIPLVYITGTNGKTTSSRMLASILREAGFTVGMTSSDGVIVNQEWVEKGDWTGPGAARQVLRHPAVTSGVLETARGGLMRRGLVFNGVNAAAVTNISNDHLGTWGIHDLEGMSLAKLTVGLGVHKGGSLVLNADCEPLRKAFEREADKMVAKPFWFSSKNKADIYLQDKKILSKEDGEIIDIREIPLCLNGTAIYNAENAMVAAALALSLGISISDIQNGLMNVKPNATDSRGRSNWLKYRGADIILDFAHNPDGVKRLIEMAVQWPAKRKFIVLGQAGDRADDQIQGMAEEAVSLNADRYYLKALPKHEYERAANDVVALLRAQLLNDGVSEELIVDYPDELTAIQNMLAEARKGDLLLVLSHEELDAVIPFLESSGATWA